MLRMAQGEMLRMTQEGMLRMAQGEMLRMTQ